MRDWFVSKLPDWWVEIPSFARFALVLLVLAIVVAIAGDWLGAGLLAVAALLVFVFGSVVHRD